MAVVSVGSEINVNSGNLGGTQTNVQTARLANGGWVTAWQTDSGGQLDVMFQRFDAAGNKVGAAQLANATTAGDQVLTDIVATSNGRFTLAWTSGNTVTSRSFDGATGAATSGENNITTTGAVATGAVLVATGNNQYRVFHSSDDGGNAIIGGARFNGNGGTINASTNFTTTAVLGTTVVDATDGPAGDNQFILLSDNRVLSSTDSVVTIAGSDHRSIIKLQEDTYVIASDGTSERVAITGLFGTGTNVSTYTNGTAVSAIGASVTTGTSPDSFDKLLFNLGDGRILVIGACDPGTNTNSSDDQIYVNVYNSTTAALEGATLEVDLLGNITSALTTLSADVLTDGRVALSWSNANGLTGFDVFTRVIDPRIAAIDVSGSTGDDFFFGTDFNDVFRKINPGDTVGGGNGIDTVFLDDVSGRLIDLANLALDPNAVFHLTSVENLVGTSFGDTFYGTSGVNFFSGGGGADKLVGRDGSDTLDGGAGNDLLLAGGGDDTVNGGDGDDIIEGGQGNDVLDGAGDNDVLAGKQGSDILLGGDGNDDLRGGTEADQISGGAGNDFMSGGDGDDDMDGGNGNDSINAGNGDDVISGGDGNDVIAGGGGFNIIDGGAGTDTVSYFNVLALLGIGVYVDLQPAADLLGNVGSANAEDDVLVNIENVTGTDGADYLAGSAAANVLKGRAGDDFLLGRGSNDTLWGGDGNDSFLFEDTTGGNDRVRDFTVGSDKIVIVSDNFGDIGLGNIAASFVSSDTPAPIANGSPQIIFDNAGGGAGRLFFDADGNGAGTAKLFATLTFTTPDGLATFSAADIGFI